MTSEQQGSGVELVRLQMISDLTNRVHDHFFDDDDEGRDPYNWDAGKTYYGSIHDTLSGYSGELIKSLHAGISGSRLRDAAKLIFNSKSEGYLLAYETLGPQLDITNNTPKLSDLLDSLYLPAYRELGKKLDEFHLSGPEYAPEMIAVLNTVCAIQNRFPNSGGDRSAGQKALLSFVFSKGTPCIHSGYVISLLMSRPLDATRIAEIIMTRGTDDRTLILELLDSKSALSEGTL